MRKLGLILCAVLCLYIFRSADTPATPGYMRLYEERLGALQKANNELRAAMLKSNGGGDEDVQTHISRARIELKRADFWLRYLNPGAYRLLNAPLPVEWETEVFEKFEKPYKREGGGYTLAYLQMGEDATQKTRLISLVDSAAKACDIFSSDSIKQLLATHHHFFLCNRLFLLNLAAIYTTGFECPDADAIVPELREMVVAVGGIYAAYNERFPAQTLTDDYLELYKGLVGFVHRQPPAAAAFDHYSFIRDYVNPLFVKNQELIARYHVVSKSLVDYSLNRKANSIFDKHLYTGQNAKGIFRRVEDSTVLAEIEETGRLLFYDPILSGNNQRSCASCHKPDQYFTDTSTKTALHFDGVQRLPRNTPSLVNSGFNHLLMADGRHFTLEAQARDVMSNPAEMGCEAGALVAKVLSCQVYRKHFKKLLQYTPQETEVTVDHIASCLAWYYNTFSNSYSAFDAAMNGRATLEAAARSGFNLFMGKAQCATCHFVPQFNGVKPPYIGSEFEVLGVPANTGFTHLSADSGRYNVNPAFETLHAFRTGTVRNATRTAPYMHNGVFGTLREVIDFYDAGGGAGRSLDPGNQTLSADSLHLTETEKQDLIAFIETLTEDIPNAQVPAMLPSSKRKALKGRKPAGNY